MMDRNRFMDTPLRIGAVNYLNTKPLICDLERIAPDQVAEAAV